MLMRRPHLHPSGGSLWVDRAVPVEWWKPRVINSDMSDGFGKNPGFQVGDCGRNVDELM